MNREQKRNLTNKLKAKGFKKSYIDAFIKLKELKALPIIPEGTQVKLNYNKIISGVDYNTNVDFNKEKYHNFVETNKDKIFTVEYDEKYKNKPNLVCLKEDETVPKWLWFIGDLEVINGG